MVWTVKADLLARRTSPGGAKGRIFAGVGVSGLKPGPISEAKPGQWIGCLSKLDSHLRRFWLRHGEGRRQQQWRRQRQLNKQIPSGDDKQKSFESFPHLGDEEVIHLLTPRPAIQLILQAAAIIERRPHTPPASSSRSTTRTHRRSSSPAPAPPAVPATPHPGSTRSARPRARRRPAQAPAARFPGW
jgi:hypothetical protein